AETGVSVRAGVRDQAKARKQFGADIAFAIFDFENEKTFAELLEGVDKVFLLPPLMPNQVEVANAFVDAAKRAGVRHIVKLSAMGADASPPYTFGNWHGANEHHIRASGLASPLLRPNYFSQRFVTYFPP